MTTNNPGPGEPTPDTPGYVLVRRWVVRLLVAGMLLGFAGMAGIIIWLSNVVGTLNRTVDAFHRSSIADRRDIACTLVQPYPDTIPGALALRKKYDCPPFGPQPSVPTPSGIGTSGSGGS